MTGVRDWIGRRPVLAAALVYTALALVLYAPALRPGHTLSGSDYLWTAAPWAASRPASIPTFGSNFELVDADTQFEPFLAYSRDRLPHAPLWNPYVGAGRPFLADAQSAVLSPFSLPAYVLPFRWSFGIEAVLKVLVAALGAFLLARALAMRWGGALLTGLVFGFSLFFLVWIPWPQTNVWAFLPWLLWGTERLLGRPDRRRAAALAVVVALQFLGGHPESNFHLLVVAVLYGAGRLALLRRGGAAPAPGRALALLAGALAGGALLSAVTLVPFLELLRHSDDATIRADYWRIRLPNTYLLGLALPEWWGRGTTVSIGAVAQERALYVGILPLLLAAAALVRRRPDPLRLGIAALGALALAVVLGIPPIPQLLSHFPLVRTGNHIRLAIVVMLALALLAGWGLDDVRARAPALARPARGLLLALAGALALGPILLVLAKGGLSLHVAGRALRSAWAFTAPPSPLLDPSARAIVHLAAVLVALPFALAASALLLARLRGRLGGPAWTLLALALVVLDLFRAGMGQTPAIRDSAATQPVTPAIRALRDQGLDRFVGLERPLGPAPIPANLAMRYGLYDARSYDLPVERRYDTLWRRAIKDGGPTDTSTTSARLTEASLPALRLLSVTRIVQDPQDRPVTRPRLPIAYDGRDARIYADPAALPRAGVVGTQQVVPSESAQLGAVLAPGFDGRRSLVTGAPLPGLTTAGAQPGGAVGPAAGSARIVDYAPEHVLILATARRPAALVLTDLSYPGWRATLDGRSVPLHRVDYLLRGTALPAGRHTVELTYRPVSWRAGWIISALALLALLGVLLSTASRPSRGRARARAA